MTKEQRIAEMAKLRYEVEQLVERYNTILNTDELPAPAEGEEPKERMDLLKELDEEMTDKCNEYTGLSRIQCFEDCKDHPDGPMIAACLTIDYPTIGVKDTENKETKVTTRSVVDKYKDIDLQRLHKYVKGGIGAEKDWIYKAEKLNFLMMVRVAKELGWSTAKIKEASDCYAISEIAAQLDMGKTPTSNTQLLTIVKEVMKAMLGDKFPAKSHDVAYLVNVQTSPSNKRGFAIKVANHSKFRGYLLRVGHHLLTGEDYELEYKAKKETKGSASADPKADADTAADAAAPAAAPAA